MCFIQLIYALINELPYLPIAQVQVVGSGPSVSAMGVVRGAVGVVGSILGILQFSSTIEET